MEGKAGRAPLSSPQLLLTSFFSEETYYALHSYSLWFCDLSLCVVGKIERNFNLKTQN